MRVTTGRTFDQGWTPEGRDFVANYSTHELMQGLLILIARRANASFGLMAVLAAIFLIPQASAHITNNTQYMLQHIYNFVDGTEAKTNNPPEDPADQSLIDTQLHDIQNSIECISVGGSAKKSMYFDLSANPTDSNEEADLLI